ncbi:hypothetical protein [Salinarimonas soli]|uniref:Haloacid dehalogenase-like hydrolase n=1 Tax=Salinarimonas soli TaxID=1638099 RepID=A0A5B2VS08_9HYPH|nr:hypothetical protein [Salinarimonas soli]KAA2241126.1 hypothetical protein F0L46_04835 [Salinarimonas soli]
MQTSLSREIGPPSSEVRPEDAVRAAVAQAEPGTLVLVNFDETLWLRNSTEEYLRALRPRLLAVLILGIIDLLRPWLMMHGADKRRLHRDWIRVATTSILLPWSLLLWRSAARTRAAALANRTLVAALATRADLDIQVVTLGFDRLVNPLLRRILPTARLGACDRLWSVQRARDGGKFNATQASVGPERISRAIVITNSEEDAPLLSACAQPFLIRWPEARFKPAFSHSYLPFAYTELGKRAGQRYILRHVVLEDVALLCIASAWLMPHPLPGAISLLILHLCFWLVYEIGYAENDLVSTKYEAKPNLPPTAAEQGKRMHAGMAWLTALLASAPAILLLIVENRSALPLVSDIESVPLAFMAAFAIWSAYLLASRAAYWVYNRVATQPRTYLYPVLQIFRTVGYGVLVPLNLLGVQLLLAHALVRWVPYLNYRYVGHHWPGPVRLLTLAVFLIFCVGGFALEGWSFFGSQFVAAVAWLSFRAHEPLRIFVGKFRFDARQAGNA